VFFPELAFLSHFTNARSPMAEPTDFRRAFSLRNWPLVRFFSISAISDFVATGSPSARLCLPHYENIFRTWFSVEVLRTQRDLVYKWPDASWGGEHYKANSQKNKDESLADIEEQIAIYRAIQAASGGLIL